MSLDQIQYIRSKSPLFRNIHIYILYIYHIVYSWLNIQYPHCLPIQVPLKSEKCHPNYATMISANKTIFSICSRSLKVAICFQSLHGGFFVSLTHPLPPPEFLVSAPEAAGSFQPHTKQAPSSELGDSGANPITRSY